MVFLDGYSGHSLVTNSVSLANFPYLFSHQMRINFAKSISIYKLLGAKLPKQRDSIHLCRYKTSKKNHRPGAPPLCSSCSPSTHPSPRTHSQRQSLHLPPPIDLLPQHHQARSDDQTLIDLLGFFFFESAIAAKIHF